MADESRTLKAYKKFKKNNLRFRLISLDSSPSLPLPIIINRKPLLSFFFYIAKKDKKKEKIKIYRPSSRIIIEIQSSGIVYYRDYNLLDKFPENPWNEPIGEFPHDEISTLTLQEYNQMKDDLLSDYDRYFDLLQGDNQDDVFRKNFSEKFYKLCEPCLLEFMRKIDIKYFKWLNGMELSPIYPRTSIDNLSKNDIY